MAIKQIRNEQIINSFLKVDLELEFEFELDSDCFSKNNNLDFKSLFCFRRIPIIELLK